MTKIFFGGVCALVLTMGVSRFSYTPMLPIMQEETILGIASGGWLATIHYLGYLFGVLATLKTESLKSRQTFYFFGLLLSVISTFMMALAENFLLWSLARFIAGFCGAAGIIICAGLVMQWVTENTSQTPQMGKLFAGAGIGIVLSALSSMVFNLFHLKWNEQWLAYGVIGLFLFFPAWILRPKLTVDKEKVDINLHQHKKIKSDNLDTRPRDFYKLLTMYFFAGFGFVVSATFTVAIVKTNPQIGSIGDFVWLLVGLSSVPSVVIWDKVERNFGMLKALCFALGFHSISLFLTAFYSNLAILVVSAFLFGISNLGVVSLTMTLAGRECPENPGKEMAKLTIAFAFALVVGPSIAGMLAESNGTYFSALLLSALMLVSGIVLLLMRDRRIGYN